MSDKTVKDLKEENRLLREALAPFAKFKFGPNWMGHTFIEREGDVIVDCGYDEKGARTNVDVWYSDFDRARRVYGDDVQ